MITPLFLPLLISSELQDSPVEIRFGAPKSVLERGLPLRLPFEIQMHGPTLLTANYGTNRVSWTEVRIVGPAGEVVAASKPEINLSPRRGDQMISVGPQLAPGSSRSGTIVVRLDTSRIAPGDYTIHVSGRLPLLVRGAGGVVPDSVAEASFPLRIINDPEAVSRRADTLLTDLLRPNPKEVSEADVARELFLVDRAVVLPLLAKTKTSDWNGPHLGYAARGLVPYASYEDAAALRRLLGNGVPTDALPAIDVLRRSRDSEVAKIGSELMAGNVGGTQIP